MTTVWIYVDTTKEVGDVDHLKVFATPELADCAVSQRGFFPRPAQVSDGFAGFLYFGNTLNAERAEDIASDRSKCRILK
jgi:hypothetical protein